MNLQDRTKRDIEIMRAVRVGDSSLKIAKRYQLTVMRINQIIEREKWKRATRKKHRPRR